MNQQNPDDFLLDEEDVENKNLTAKPTHTLGQEARDSTELDYGTMNLRDAKESGYTDKKGHAISKTRHDIKGIPTGAYTDIGAGRSSAVRHESDLKRHSRSYPGDVGDIAEEFHIGGGLEGYGHKIEPNNNVDKS